MTTSRLLINTPDGDLRVNAVQNEEQRAGRRSRSFRLCRAGISSRTQAVDCHWLLDRNKTID